jgi:hypothetical protein
LIFRAWFLSAEKGSSDESSGIGKKDLRQVQGHYPQGSSKGDLRERKAQAAPGLVGSLAERGSFHDSRQLSVVSKKLARETDH